MKSLIRLQQCQTLTELPTILYTSYILQVGGIQLMFWLKQHSIYRCEATLETKRKSESIASMRVGKSRRLLSLTVTPSKMICTAKKQATLAENSSSPKTLEADRISMILRLQAQSLSMISLYILMVCIALRMNPTPTYEPTQTARSNIFHST